MTIEAKREGKGEYSVNGEFSIPVKCEHKREWREFWIDSEDADPDDNYAGNAMYEHPKQGPPQWQATCIHVIEHAALEDLNKNCISLYLHEQRMLEKDREIEILKSSKFSWEVQKEIEIYANSDRQWNQLLEKNKKMEECLNYIKNQSSHAEMTRDEVMIIENGMSKAAYRCLKEIGEIK